jgi:hypothetical protein
VIKRTWCKFNNDFLFVSHVVKVVELILSRRHSSRTAVG